jgi:hypothetical protein
MPFSSSAFFFFSLNPLQLRLSNHSPVLWKKCETWGKKRGRGGAEERTKI